MILSHRHRFIFFKTTKTGGTSIEIALSRYCGPDDIITPISPEDEALRSTTGGRKPQHHLAPVRAYRPRDLGRLLWRGRRKYRYYNHITAAELRATVAPETWRSYFKFCVTRNPWDRAVSMYYWKHRQGRPPPFSEFLSERQLRNLWHRGPGVYTIDGTVAADRVCRHETLDADLDEVRRALQLPEPLSLPRAKSQFRHQNRDYRSCYTSEDRDRVADVFADEIDRLGYEF